MSIDPEERDNARVGYQAAVSLMSFEGNLVWTRFGLMLLAHTIILTAIGLTSDTPQTLRSIILIGLSVVGLMLCYVWWLVNDIGFRYFFYWLHSARELEETYLSPVRTLSRGTPPTAEDEAVVPGGTAREHRVAGRDRVRVAFASKLIIMVVATLYIAFLLLFIVHLLRSHG